VCVCGLGIVFLDEVDKIGSVCVCVWSRYSIPGRG